MQNRKLDCKVAVKTIINIELNHSVSVENVPYHIIIMAMNFIA